MLRVRATIKKQPAFQTSRSTTNRLHDYSQEETQSILANLFEGEAANDLPPVEFSKLTGDFHYYDSPEELDRTLSQFSLRRIRKLINAHISQNIGVFAKVKIPRGSIIAVYTGEHCESKAESSNYALDIENPQGEISHCVDAGPKGNVARFVNHSRVPNVHWAMNEQNQPCYVAARDILPGEGLYSDYGDAFWGRGKEAPEWIFINSNDNEKSFNQVFIENESLYSKTVQKCINDLWHINHNLLIPEFFLQEEASITEEDLNKAQGLLCVDSKTKEPILTPLMLACLQNDADLILRLLCAEEYALIDYVNPFGQTALFYLTTFLLSGEKAEEIYARFGLKMAAGNLQQQDKENNTALHYCVMHNNYALAKTLLRRWSTEYKFTPFNFINNDGFDAMQLAISRADAELVELFCNPDAVSQDFLVQSFSNWDENLRRALIQAADTSFSDLLKIVGHIRIFCSEKVMAKIESLIKYFQAPPPLPPVTIDTCRISRLDLATLSDSDTESVATIDGETQMTMTIKRKRELDNAQEAEPENKYPATDETDEMSDGLDLSLTLADSPLDSSELLLPLPPTQACDNSDGLDLTLTPPGSPDSPSLRLSALTVFFQNDTAQQAPSLQQVSAFPQNDDNQIVPRLTNTFH